MCDKSFGGRSLAERNKVAEADVEETKNSEAHCHLLTEIRSTYLKVNRVILSNTHYIPGSGALVLKADYQVLLVKTNK